MQHRYGPDLIDSTATDGNGSNFWKKLFGKVFRAFCLCLLLLFFDSCQCIETLSITKHNIMSFKWQKGKEPNVPNEEYNHLKTSVKKQRSKKKGEGIVLCGGTTERSWPSDSWRWYRSLAFVAPCSSHQSLLTNSFPQLEQSSPKNNTMEQSAVDVMSAGTFHSAYA